MLLHTAYSRLSTFVALSNYERSTGGDFSVREYTPTLATILNTTTMIKQHILLLIIFLAPSFASFGQPDYLKEGNVYLNNGQLDKAEQAFREGIKKEPENLIYQCQLGLTLIKQEKYNEAQKVLDKVLAQDPNQVAAIWYSGIGNYKGGDNIASINYFEKALTYLDPSSGQYYSAHWYIGKSYFHLLGTKGLTYDETNRMIECYKEYLRLQPNANDAIQMKDFLDKVEAKRPPDNVKVWIYKY